MKMGRYFHIPECPSDVERIWQHAAPVDQRTAPAWAASDAPDSYRQVAAHRAAAFSSTDEAAVYSHELQRLHDAGLIIDGDVTDPSPQRVYVSAPRRWSIGIYGGLSPLDVAPMPGVMNPVLTCEDVSDVTAAFIADPFMIEVDDVWFMFFEVMNWRANKGEIGLATSDDGVRWVYQRIALAESFHLSYPYVFEWMGDYYLIPESHQAGAIRLYKASRFPNEWCFLGNLIEGPYFVDSSVFHHGGSWWLFTDASISRRHDTLRLYCSDDLMGPWREHPMSPVVAGDATRARPAGRVIAANERVLRYAQACIPVYGTEVRAFEITALDRSCYREREVDRSPVLGPSGAGWNAHGIHHIDPHLLKDGRWMCSVDGWIRS